MARASGSLQLAGSEQVIKDLVRALDEIGHRMAGIGYALHAFRGGNRLLKLETFRNRQRQILAAEDEVHVGLRKRGELIAAGKNAVAEEQSSICRIAGGGSIGAERRVIGGVDESGHVVVDGEITGGNRFGAAWAQHRGLVTN